MRTRLKDPGVYGLWDRYTTTYNFCKGPPVGTPFLYNLYGTIILDILVAHTVAESRDGERSHSFTVASELGRPLDTLRGMQAYTTPHPSET